MPNAFLFSDLASKTPLTSGAAMPPALFLWMDAGDQTMLALAQSQGCEYGGEVFFILTLEVNGHALNLPLRFGLPAKAWKQLCFPLSAEDPQVRNELAQQMRHPEQSEEARKALEHCYNKYLGGNEYYYLQQHYQQYIQAGSNQIRLRWSGFDLSRPNDQAPLPQAIAEVSLVLGGDAPVQEQATPQETAKTTETPVSTASAQGKLHLVYDWVNAGLLQDGHPLPVNLSLYFSSDKTLLALAQEAGSESGGEAHFVLTATLNGHSLHLPLRFGLPVKSWKEYALPVFSADNSLSAELNQLGYNAALPEATRKAAQEAYKQYSGQVHQQLQELLAQHWQEGANSLQLVWSARNLQRSDAAVPTTSLASLSLQLHQEPQVQAPVEQAPEIQTHNGKIEFFGDLEAVQPAAQLEADEFLFARVDLGCKAVEMAAARGLAPVMDDACFFLGQLSIQGETITLPVLRLRQPASHRSDFYLPLWLGGRLDLPLTRAQRSSEQASRDAATFVDALVNHALTTAAHGFLEPKLKQGTNRIELALYMTDSLSETAQPIGDVVAKGAVELQVSDFTYQQLVEKYKPEVNPMYERHEDEGIVHAFHQQQLHKILFSKQAIPAEHQLEAGLATEFSLSEDIHGRAYLPHSLHNFYADVGNANAGGSYVIRLKVDGQLLREFSDSVSYEDNRRWTTIPIALAARQNRPQAMQEFAEALKKLEAGTHTVEVEMLISYLDGQANYERRYQTIATGTLKLQLTEEERKAFIERYEFKYAEPGTYTTSSSSSYSSNSSSPQLITVIIENRSGRNINKLEVETHGSTRLVTSVSNGNMCNVTSARVGGKIWIDGREYRTISASDKDKNIVIR